MTGAKNDWYVFCLSGGPWPRRIMAAAISFSTLAGSGIIKKE
jgi:hypothetical protein